METKQWGSHENWKWEWEVVKTSRVGEIDDAIGLGLHEKGRWRTEEGTGLAKWGINNRGHTLAWTEYKWTCWSKQKWAEGGPDDAITMETKELSIKTTACWHGSLDEAKMSWGEPMENKKMGKRKNAPFERWEDTFIYIRCWKYI
jgi:hypothetical protein